MRRFLLSFAAAIAVVSALPAWSDAVAGRDVYARPTGIVQPGLRNTLQDLLTRVSLNHFPELPQVDYSRAWLTTQPVASGGAEWQCLTQALYFEARGETVKGQFAVAEVILNRVDSSQFPNTVCSVVHQGTGKRYQCQFTFTCDGYPETVHEPQAWADVGKVARAMLDGAPRVLTEGATYYHSKSVHPRWASRFTRTAVIGRHEFYRAPIRVSRN